MDATLKIWILVLAVLLPATYANAQDLDRCSTTGENPGWQLIRDNPYRIDETKVIRNEVPWPGDELTHAVEFGYENLIYKLLQHPELVKLHGGDALSAAASMGRISVSGILINDGISPNAKNENGTTALWTAVQYGCIDELEFLINNGAQVNFAIKPHHNTPMIEAITDHHYQAAAMLLKFGYQIQPWELKTIKTILMRQSEPSVWDYLFAKLDTESHKK